MTTPPVPAVRFTSVLRHFGQVKAVDDVSFEVQDGEFFSMLGPSGSGKTTCLRMIAGFDQPTSGSIKLHGLECAGLPPFERDVNTVFQDYALFPHMSVGDNIAYGPMLKRMSRPERARLVDEMLDLVRLPGLAARRPSQLSGGQRQRIALARALINHPRVLLLDEPLGALDLKLRQQMQVELKSIQKRVGITFIFVTHDQEEALTMSDRIAVFNNGKIEQIGTPSEIYEQPHTAFVAGFVGVSNLVDEALAAQIGGVRGAFAIRPEKIRIVDPSAEVGIGMCSTLGRVADVVYLGMQTRYLIDIDGGMQLTVAQQNTDEAATAIPVARGVPVRLLWRQDACSVLQVS